MASPRIGIGYDSHPLVASKKLVIGGAEVPFDKGLEGWSDGDVLTHAIANALLGAAGMGDIGRHFPPGDPRYRDAPSLLLLKEVGERLKSAGWSVVNIDATVVASAPRLARFTAEMEQHLGEALGIGADLVSVKSATGNTLGFAGRGEGIAAQAVAMIEGSNR